jgi:hypothetical protein
MKRGVWGYGDIEIQGYRDRRVRAALFLYRYPATPLPRYLITPRYPFKL